MKILLLLVGFLQAFCQLTKTKDFFQSFWQKSLHSTLYGLQDLKPSSNARRVTCNTPRSGKQHAQLTDSPQQKQAQPQRAMMVFYHHARGKMEISM